MTTRLVPLSLSRVLTRLHIARRGGGRAIEPPLTAHAMHVTYVPMCSPLSLLHSPSHGVFCFLHCFCFLFFMGEILTNYGN